MSEQVQAIPPFIERHAPQPSLRRRAARPTTREWIRHTALLLLTLLTATISGVMLSSTVEPVPDLAPPTKLIEYIAYLPAYYLSLTFGFIQQAIAQPALLWQGVMFACALLAILAAHESGHYIACRRYQVDATLPFFIPAPPLFLAGTFGAFIKIKSPIPSRRALFDIGVAGPLAGFLVCVPVAVAGILMLQPAPPVTGTGGAAIYFHDPLLFRLIGHALGVEFANTATNPFYMAAWIGLLVTSLNLMPVSQLDGGHATYSVLGRRIHKRLGYVAFAMVSTLAILGWVWHNSPSGFLYSVLLAVLLLRVRHPQAGDESEPLGGTRIFVAVITLLVFILSFLPFPISID